MSASSSGSAWARYGSLATAAAAVIGASYEVQKAGDVTTLAAVLLTIGVMLVGAWLVLEVHFLLDEYNPKEDESDSD